MFAAIIDTRAANARREIDAVAGAIRGNPGPVRTWADDDGTLAVAAATTGILPEDVFDRQPFVDGDLVFVCQARIDNRDEILQALGVPPGQRPQLADSDVAHRAYRRWGEACVQRLTGDYAFAAHHRDSRRTIAAVNHVGSVRLHYAECDGLLIIAPQLNALLACRRVPRELNLTRLGLLVAPKLGGIATPYVHVQMLRGGHLLCQQAGGRVTTRLWWRPDTTIRASYRDPNDYVRDAREIFDRAVAARLRASGPIATTLSGGLDSTLVSAVAARHLEAQGREIFAYTSIPEPGLSCTVDRHMEASDWPYAVAVACGHHNMRHASVTPGGRCSLDILDAIHARSRTSTRNTANNLWYDTIATRMAKSGARVLLTGDKGNATISYERGDNKTVRGFVVDSIAGLRALGRLARRRAGNVERAGAIALTQEFRARNDAALTRQPTDGGRPAMIRFMTAPQKAWCVDPIAQWNLEFRDPTADRELVERLLSFPMAAFAIGGRPRGLARAMGEGEIPDVVRLRTRRGAQVPELAGIIAAHAPKYRAALEQVSRSSVVREIIDINEVQASLARVAAGRAANYEAPMIDRALDVAKFIAGGAA